MIADPLMSSAWSRSEPLPGSVGASGFLAMQEAFAEAAGRHGELASARQLEIAGKAVPMRVVGEALARIVDDAFAHLIEPGDGSDPRPDGRPGIYLWDRSEADVPAPPRPASVEWTSGADGWRLDAYEDLRYVREERADSLIWFDRATGDLFAMFEDARKFLLYERARPLSRLIPEFCRHLDAHDVHAAAVAWRGKSALIVGGSGRGKTTTSIDCAVHGLEFLGDDSVAIAESHGGFSVNSLYASARAHPVQMHRWPGLNGHWIRPGPADDKALLMPLSVPAVRMARTASVCAIIVPRQDPSADLFEPVSGSAAFHSLVRDSSENRRFSLRRDQFQRFAKLTQMVPSFAVRINRPPEAVAQTIAGIIGRFEHA